MSQDMNKNYDFGQNEAKRCIYNPYYGAYIQQN